MLPAVVMVEGKVRCDMQQSRKTQRQQPRNPRNCASQRNGEPNENRVVDRKYALPIFGKYSWPKTTDGEIFSMNKECAASRYSEISGSSEPASAAAVTFDRPGRASAAAPTIRCAGVFNEQPWNESPTIRRSNRRNGGPRAQVKDVQESCGYPEIGLGTNSASGQFRDLPPERHEVARCGRTVELLRVATSGVNRMGNRRGRQSVADDGNVFDAGGRPLLFSGQ